MVELEVKQVRVPTPLVDLVEEEELTDAQLVAVVAVVTVEVEQVVTTILAMEVAVAHTMLAQIKSTKAESTKAMAV